MGNPMAERGEAAALAEEAGASARAGTGRWLLVRALPGMGRTALLDEVVRRESARGAMAVRQARGSREEGAFPFALLRQLFPVTEEEMPFVCESSAAEQRTFHRLLVEVARDARRKPLLLAVDDLHEADAPSKRWLGYLARRLAGLPVFLLLTASADGFVGPLPEAAGTTSHLDPLSPAAVRRLAGSAAAAAHGNPALVHALLADAAGGPGPSRYGRTVAGWVRSADPVVRALLLALAVAAQHCPHPRAVMREVAALGPEFRTPPAGADHLARILCEPSAREAALGAAHPAELAVIRGRMARELDESGASAATVAAHLVHLDPLPERWMTQSLEDAAEEALREGRTAQAVAFLRHALTGPLPVGRRADITLRLGALELRHNADAGVRRLRAALELHADPGDRAAAASALGTALAAQGRTESALKVLHRENRTADDAGCADALRSVTALIASHDAVAWRDAVAGMRESAVTASAATEPLIRALVAEYDAGAGRLSAAAVLDLVLPRLASPEPVEPRIRTAWLGSAATLLQWADRLTDARALADACLPAPPALPDPADVGHQCLVSVRAEAALMAGDFGRVLAENTPLLDACTERGIRLTHLTAMVALARHELGEHEAAWRLLGRGGAENPDSSWEWNELHYARGVLHAYEGDHRAALDAFLACGAGQDARDFVSPVATPWRSGAALALARLGRPVEGRALADEELAHARTWGTPRTVGRALRARAAVVGSRQALESLTESVALLRTAPAPVELVESLLDLGRARVQVGNRRKGSADLREAYDLAVQLLAPSSTGRGRVVVEARDAVAANATRRTCRTAPVDGDSPLSPSERRIVGLAVQGRTNVQICAELHLSRRTVETHLTNAYRKLGVTRRTQLVARLAEFGAT
ncbi:LuxR C-terminal-related transcriptional regulator [Streptomyces populi]|uniref:LuxR family transcriptional regulator n=1 Tax=Streptomyces populi TaxID=2058924 RepID=UPI0013A6B836|nr:LuxR family transcriptional regulator [Streptomyces populi]